MALERSQRELRAALDSLRSVPEGGTAVGTGLGAPAEYARLAVRHISELSG